MAEIKVGTLVLVSGVVVHITTMNPWGKFFERDKFVHPACPIFGMVWGIYEVQKEKQEPVLDGDGNFIYDENLEVKKRVVEPAKFLALVKWAGHKHRTSILPVEQLEPAINDKKRFTPVELTFTPEQ